jgi:hypothetical protein
VTSWRYIAQELPSGRFLDYEVPLERVALTRALSAPDRLVASIPVYLPHLATILRPWGVALWVEADGKIRGGGIVTPAVELEDQAVRLDCVGITGYPTGMPWLAEPRAYGKDRPAADPLAIVREVWAHLQSYPAGDIGVDVDSTASSARVGSAEEPFELMWWATHDLGRVIDDLAAETPFDYRIDSAWSGEALRHRLRLGYPTLGGRRTDLRMALGENVIGVPPMGGNDADYATEVLGLGAGEGATMKRAVLPRSGATGLRRVHVHTDKTARSESQLASRIRARMPGLDGAPQVHRVAVTDHPHARIGSFDVGDEVYLTGSSGWATFDRWVRIVELTINPDESDRVELVVVEV